MSMEYKNEPKEHSDAGQPENQEPQEQEEFSFLQEKIKEEPIDKKKLAGKIGRMAGFGLIFGLAASLGFYAIRPWAETKFHKDPQTVMIPKDEEAEQEQDVQQPTEEPITPILTLDNYKQLNQAYYEVASEADKSVVEVTGVHANEEWIKKKYDMENSVSGLIIADNGQELLILTKSSILNEVESLTVTFGDGSRYGASLKKKDGNLGLAVISILRDTITEGTWGHIKPAVLGNSNILRQGEGIIALGKPFGYSGGLGYGIVSSVRNEIVTADGKYGLISTDITGTETGTGVLVNLQGEVVGFVDQSISDKDSMNLTTALAISDIKKEIEALSNGISIPYIGIIGSEVTQAISEAQSIPAGVYVKETEADSPAMKAGIQSGDIITKVGDDKVASLSGYFGVLFSCKTGDTIKVTGQRRGANGYVEIEFTVTIGSKE